jgi:diguanylate cyclase (GGDEF)-like protein/PAS domain S-box-containing protein
LAEEPGLRSRRNPGAPGAPFPCSHAKDTELALAQVSSGEQARRAPVDRVQLGVLGAALLLFLWLLVLPAGAAVFWLAQTAIDILTLVFAVRLFRLRETTRPERRFWVGVGISMGLSGTGDVFQTFLVLTGQDGGEVSPVQTAFVVTGMVLAVITMLCHPLGGRGRQRLRLWLDAATVLAAVAAFLWYFVFAGSLDGGGRDDRVTTAATAVAMMLVSFGLVKLAFSPTSPFTRAAGVVGALGVAGNAVVAPLTAMLADGSQAGVVYLVQLIPCLLVPVSLRIQEMRTRRHGGRRNAAARLGFSRMPYVAVAATQILLVAGLATAGGGPRIWGVAAGVVLSTGLVLARQVAAFHDNERLTIEISDQKEWFSALVQQASDLTVVTDGESRVSYASPAAVRALGGPVAGSEPLSARLHPEDRPVMRAMTDRLAAAPGTAADAEVRLRHADGSYRWLHVIGTDLRGNASIEGLVWNGRDITEAHRLQEELRHQATHDALTGLPNRTLLQQRIAEAEPDTRLAMLLIDLDGFKQINDGHGHHAGDQVLVAVAGRITTLLSGNGTVARLGGDEFAVLLPGADVTSATILAEVIAAAVAQPIGIVGEIVSVGASVGVAAGTPADADRMLRDADAEMYRRKQSRKATVNV